MSCNRIKNELEMFATHPSVLLLLLRPVFGFTAQYIVNVDDFFLHYIQKECICIEFHQAVGTEYKTIATGKLRMNGLLDKSHGRDYGTLKLLGRSLPIVQGIPKVNMNSFENYFSHIFICQTPF